MFHSMRGLNQSILTENEQHLRFRNEIKIKAFTKKIQRSSEAAFSVCPFLKLFITTKFIYCQRLERWRIFYSQEKCNEIRQYFGLMQPKWAIYLFELRIISSRKKVGSILIKHHTQWLMPLKTISKLFWSGSLCVRSACQSNPIEANRKCSSAAPMSAIGRRGNWQKNWIIPKITRATDEILFSVSILNGPMRECLSPYTHIYRYTEGTIFYFIFLTEIVLFFKFIFRWVFAPKTSIETERKTRKWKSNSPTTTTRLIPTIKKKWMKKLFS